MTSIYTTTLQVAKLDGIGVEIFDESLGTGDNTEDSYDLTNGNVVNGSYKLNYGDVDSNDLTALTETTHYTISIDEGRILLTSAGVTLINEKVLYASYIYSPKASDSILAGYLASAEEQTEKKTGNYWGPSKANTEYFSGNSTEYPSTDEPFAEEYNEPDFEVLKYKGIISLTTVKFLVRGGSTVTETTIPLTAMDLDTESSTVTFLLNPIPNGTRNVEIVYTHGYAAVPAQISDLTSYFAALQIYAYISGGSYDDATGFTMGRKQVQIGEAWVNIREVISQAEKRIASILDDVGRKMDVC